MKRPLIALVVLVATVTLFAFVRCDRRMAPKEEWSRIRMSYPRGTTWTYTLAWRGEQHQKEEGLAIDATIELAFELTVRSYGAQQGAWLLGVRVDDVPRHALSFMGKDGLDDDDTAKKLFVGREAFLLVDDRGRIGKVFFPKDTPSDARHLLANTLLQTALVLPDGSEESWEEDHAKYTRSGKADISRTRQGFVGTTTAHIDGPLTRLETHEQGIAGAARVANDVKLELVRTGTWDPASLDLAALDERRAGETSPDLPRRMLEARAKGVTLDEIEDALIRAGARSTFPDGADFLARSAALLEVHPEMCAGLASLATGEPRCADGCKTLVLDVLAHVGSDAAQSAMVSVLETQKGSAAFPSMIQRMGSLAKPAPESVRVVEQAYDDGALTPATHTAAAATLGAVAGKVARGGDAASGDRLVEKLEKELAVSKEQGSAPRRDG